MSDGFASLERARSLIAVGRMDAALDELGPALVDPATEAGAWCLHTQALLAKRDIGQARKSVRKAMELDPGAEWPHRLHALVLQAAGEHEDALRAATEAVRVAPHVAECQHVLAICQSNVRGKKVDAWKTAQRMVAQHPHSALAHSTMGVVAMKQKRLTTAEEHLREALRIEPQAGDVALLLAEVLKSLGRRQEAGEALLAAGRADPTDKDVRKSLGRLGMPAVGFAGFGVVKAVASVQAFRALRYLHPADGVSLFAGLLLLAGGFLTVRRIWGTRGLPEQVHRGLMNDHRNYALGWLSAIAFGSLPFAIWAAAAPVDRGRSPGLAIGLVVFCVLANATVLRFWVGRLPNLFPSTTAWLGRRGWSRRNRS